jgi:hypothetical protein
LLAAWDSEDVTSVAMVCPLESIGAMIDTALCRSEWTGAY